MSEALLMRSAGAVRSFSPEERPAGDLLNTVNAAVCRWQTVSASTRRMRIGSALDLQCHEGDETAVKGDPSVFPPILA